MSENSDDGVLSLIWDAFVSLVDIRPPEGQRKNPKAWIRPCVKALVLYVVLPWATIQLWNPLKATIGTYPAQIGFVLTVLVTVLFAQMWIHSRLQTKVSSEKVLEMTRVCEELETRLAAKEVDCAFLGKENASLRTPADPLDHIQRRIITCILCAGEITKVKIITETGVAESSVTPAMHTLRYGALMFIRKCGRTRDGSSQEIFTLTEQGKQYAIEQGIAAIKQDDEPVQPSENEAEQEALREQNATLWQGFEVAKTRLDAAYKEIASLKETIGKLQRTQIPPPPPPQQIRFPGSPGSS